MESIVIGRPVYTASKMYQPIEGEACMHLDLTDANTLQGIDELAEDFIGHILHILWPRRLQMYEDADLPTIIYQAGAQQISAHACTHSCFQFGLLCSQFYPHYGSILSNDVTFYYLIVGFQGLQIVRIDS